MGSKSLLEVCSVILQMANYIANYGSVPDQSQRSWIQHDQNVGLRRLPPG